MSLDWSQFENELDVIVHDASERTDEVLADKVSSLTRMTTEEVQELFPDPADVKKLAALMKIVKSADDRNTKINNIERNSKEFAGIVLTLISKFA